MSERKLVYICNDGSNMDAAVAESAQKQMDMLRDPTPEQDDWLGRQGVLMITTAMQTVGLARTLRSINAVLLAIGEGIAKAIPELTPEEVRETTTTMLKMCNFGIELSRFAEECPRCVVRVPDQMKAEVEEAYAKMRAAEKGEGSGD